MNVQPWENVKELLYEAMKLLVDRRSQFLDDACSSNPHLRAEVDSLLDAVGEIDSGFMNASPIERAMIDDLDFRAGTGPFEQGMSIAGRYQA